MFVFLNCTDDTYVSLTLHLYFTDYTLAVLTIELVSVCLESEILQSKSHLCRFSHLQCLYLPPVAT